MREGGGTAVRSFPSSRAEPVDRLAMRACPGERDAILHHHETGALRRRRDVFDQPRKHPRSLVADPDRPRICQRFDKPLAPFLGLHVFEDGGVVDHQRRFAWSLGQQWLQIRQQIPSRRCEADRASRHRLRRARPGCARSVPARPASRATPLHRRSGHRSGSGRARPAELFADVQSGPDAPSSCKRRPAPDPAASREVLSPCRRRSRNHNDRAADTSQPMHQLQRSPEAVAVEPITAAARYSAPARSSALSATA